MNPNISLHFIAAVFLIFILFPTSFSTDDEQFTECNLPYNCVAVQNITYPFWGFGRPSFCGRQGFELHCQNNESLVLTTDEQDFRVLKLKPMTIARTDLWEDHCNPEIRNTSLNYTLFEQAETVRNITLFFNCTNFTGELLVNASNSFDCVRDGVESLGFYADDRVLNANFPANHSFPECGAAVRVPVPQAALDKVGRELNLGEALREGFEVNYEADLSLCSACEDSGGICGSNHADLSRFACLCRSHPYALVCPKNDGKDWKLKVTIGLITAFVSITIMSVIFYIYLRRNKNQHAPFLSRNISPDSSSMTDAEKGGSHYGVHLFNYGELEEATNHFDSAKELGDGGFGTVYHGKLRDGRAVAVKRLYENNYRRVEQFMNEVDILTRLRHQNLVSLYGCTSRHSRELLLVYEYIPNGTVADHLHGERAKPGELPWPIRMNIAIDTACALAYLHASEIIHRDVKTNNILLDNNFCVKVADFGLSRLFPTDVTHVSTAPQGTPGYVDPEYHQCYQLTSKSDVYSFGVVLMELISSQPAVDITRHRHEINLSTMAINKIQNHELHKLVDTSLGFESDHTIRKTIGAVAELAFRCLQNAKEMRPSMVEVLQDLKDIQSDDYNEHKAAEMDIPKDDAVLLKNEQLPFSPDSVTTKWISTDTIRNPSG